MLLTVFLTRGGSSWSGTTTYWISAVSFPMNLAGILMAQWTFPLQCVQMTSYFFVFAFTMVFICTSMVKLVKKFHVVIHLALVTKIKIRLRCATKRPCTIYINSKRLVYIV